MFKKVMGLTALLALGVSAGVQAQTEGDIIVSNPQTDVIPYVIDARNVVARSGFGLCWRTGFWTPAAAETALAGQFPVGCSCDGDVVPAEKCTAPVVHEHEVIDTEPENERVKLNADALFDFDKAVLKPGGKERLNEIILRAKSINLEVMLATGHTDRIGTEAYNQSLSERRADAVKEYLVSQGIEADRIYTEGKGKTQPVTGDQCKRGMNRKALLECLQPDRRVEVEMIGTVSR